MNEILDRIAKLSAEKRALLVSKLSPLSFAQQRLWFFDQLQPGSPYYNMPAAVHLRGPLDVAALERSFSEIVRRHEVLRTNPAMVDGQLVQIISPSRAVALPLIDLTQIAEAERQPVAEKLAAQEAAQPFNLSAGLMIRFALLRLGQQEHVMLVTMHHIASDAWSIGLLIRELSVLYAMFTSGQPSPLPDLSIQYADYSRWQRQWLSGDVLERELDYWRERLAGAPQSLDLPVDRPRPAVQRFQGGHQSHTLSPELTEAIKALCRQEGATLFMALLAAFQTLLYRYSGQKDFCVGTPIAGRTRVETEALIGFFVNTLVMRADLVGNPTFRQLLARSRTSALGAFTHQNLPFEKLVEELQPERDLSRTPLFQVMFSVQSAQVESPELSSLSLSFWDYDTGMSQFDLTMNVIERPEGLHLTTEYCTSLFDDSTITRWLEGFERLLGSITIDPERRIDELPLLSNQQRQHLLHQATGPRLDFDSHRLVHHLIADQARLHPHHLAVSDAAAALSFAELDGRANQLARFLRARAAAAPETVVALLLRRSSAQVVAALATLKTGAAYLPIDPAYPPQRIAYMLADAGASLVISEAELTGLLDPATVPVIELEAIAEALADYSRTPLAVAVDSANPAYLIYTSGSTGQPKGVVVTHANLLNLIHWHGHRYQISPADRASQMAGPGFDASVWELWPHLAYGASVRIADEATRRSPEALQEWLLAERISIGFVPTPMAEQLMKQAWPVGVALPRLLTGGERLQGRPGAGSGLRVINHYGPTEATVLATAGEVSGEQEGSPSLGQAVANTRVYVLDERFEVRPEGVGGEIYIGGAGVGRGYQGRSAETAAAYVPDPYGESGERMYRTGDRGRYVRGEVEYLGRGDEQVKVRGYRIELGEVEGVIKGVEWVKEGVVVVRESEKAGKRLEAYVVLKEAREGWREELKRELEGRLPEYMVPRRVEEVEEIARTANGKVDRERMKREAGEEAREGEAVESKGAVEEIVEGIWSEQLGRERMGRDENFFEAGGHSLVGTAVMSRVKEAMGVEVGLKVLFETATLGAFAAAVEAAMKDARGVMTLPIRKYAQEGPAPLSFGQQRLWLTDQLEPSSAAYNIPAAVRLTGDLQIQALEHALAEIVRRHESLRTCFAVIDGQPVQVMTAPAPMKLAFYDLTEWPADERPTEVQRIVGADARQPFDLASGPLLRVGIVRVEPNEHVLYATMHHIVSDGWSMGIFIKEIGELYEAYCQGRPSLLLELPVQYGDYARWQREWMSGEALERELEYWGAELQEAPPVLDLPLDRPRPAIRSNRGAMTTTVVGQEQTARLIALGRKQRATMFMTLLTGFNVMLSRYSRTKDILIGTPVSGRTSVETEALIGFFVNTLIVRTDLSGRPTFEQLIRRVRDHMLDLQAHQDMPFELLVERLQPQRQPGHTPFFQVMFAYQNLPKAQLDLQGIAATPVAMESSTSKFDLTVAVTESAGELVIAFEYNLDIFDQATVERMAGHYRRLLEEVAANSRLVIDEINLLDDAERRLLVEDWAGATTVYGDDLCVHTLVEQQAAQRPDDIALVFEDQPITYAELDGRANQLARFLRARAAAAPEAVVALLLRRSPAQVVAALATLKTGAAYLPIDPAYPPQRIAYMLADAGASLVISEAELTGLLDPATVPVIELEAIAEALAGYSRGPLGVAVDSANPACLIYTSGSTGQPKGVVVTHQGVVRLIRNTNYIDLDASCRIAHASNVSFDAATFEIWGALMSGGQLVIVPQDTALTPADFAAFIREKGITTSFLTTALFNQIAREAPDTFSSLKHLLFGGEAADPQRVRAVLAAGAPEQLLNVYGPTESTTFTTVLRVEAVPPGATSVPIGRAISNTQVYVLDDSLNPVPIGLPGELYIGGAGLARGYVNRADLTAEKFIPDPFGKTGGRLYRTGDLVRVLADGNIDFLGRADHQVKIRGFRIELSEIETILAQHPAVRETLVSTRKDATGNMRLVAFVGADPQLGLTVPELREFLKERLPNYMVPGSYVILDRLPLTASGKLNRQALAAMELPESQAQGEYVAPSTPTEEMLAAIWSEVLGIERIGVEDNFFELGGHSLLATQIMSRIRAMFNVDLALRRLFEKPTVATLAQLIAESQNQKQGELERLTASLTPQKAEDLLANLDQLSTEEVAALLNQLAAEEQATS